jgi:hypothetical protein
MSPRRNSRFANSNRPNGIHAHRDRGLAALSRADGREFPSSHASHRSRRTSAPRTPAPAEPAGSTAEFELGVEAGVVSLLVDDQVGPERRIEADDAPARETKAVSIVVTGGNPHPRSRNVDDDPKLAQRVFAKYSSIRACRPAIVTGGISPPQPRGRMLGKTRSMLRASAPRHPRVG